MREKKLCAGIVFAQRSFTVIWTPIFLLKNVTREFVNYFWGKKSDLKKGNPICEFNSERKQKKLGWGAGRGTSCPIFYPYKSRYMQYKKIARFNDPFNYPFRTIYPPTPFLGTTLLSSLFKNGRGGEGELNFSSNFPNPFRRKKNVVVEFHPLTITYLTISFL